VTSSSKDKKFYNWLHSKGYNAFNIPKLAVLEIVDLIDGHNLELKEQEQAQKRAANKMKRRSKR